MKKLFVFAFASASLFASAQKVAKPDAYAKTITSTDLKKHLYIIAGPEMEGREAGSAGERKAAAYIENEFKRIGLQPGNNGTYRQYFPIYQDSLTEAALEVNGQKYEMDKDFNVSVNGPAAMYAFSEVVFIGSSANADSVKNANLAGKLVLVNSNSFAGVLRNKGVAGILMVLKSYPRKTPASRLARETTQFYKKVMEPLQFMISEAVAKTIGGKEYDLLQAGAAPKLLTANVLMNMTKATKTNQSSNVIGLLPGTDLKDEYLVITAHYDHEGKRGDSVIYYGADDDGSGTVSVIELAEAFAKAKAEGKGPRRSIVFMTVSAEEKGLWGSAYYGANPVYPLEKTTANLNIDMIGRIDPARTKGDSLNYVYIVGDDKLSSDLRTISETINNRYTKMELDYKFNDPKDPMRIFYRSDHYNFARYGVPIIFYFNGTHADYHKPTDTPDKINYSLLAKRAQLVFYTGWEMANRDAMLKRDIPLSGPGI